MEIKNKYENKLQDIALSSDAFTTAYFVMCLLLFVPFIANSGVRVVIWLLPICCIIPLAVMPLFYLLIHRVDMLLFGRYHLIMPISAFIAALSFVTMFSDKSVGALTFFGALLFALSITLYRYCSFSVRARLGGYGIASHSVWSVGFSALGSVGALATYAGFLYYDPENMYVDCAYVISLACVALAMFQYLVTHYGIPKLAGKRAVTVKSVYRTFFVGLDKRLFLSSFFFRSAFACIAALLLLFIAMRGMWIFTAVFMALAIIGGYGIADYFCSKYVVRRSRGISFVLAAGFVLSAALLIIASVVELGTAAFIAVVTVSSVVDGGCGALAVRQTRLRFTSIKPHATSGVVYILTELVMLLSFAVALVCAATVITIGSALTSFIYGFSAAVVLSVAGVALAGKKSNNASRLSPSYELTTQDIEQVADAGEAPSPDEIADPVAPDGNVISQPETGEAAPDPDGE